MIPEGCTHYTKFYDDVMYYRRSVRLHLNTVIDHPTECWQQIPVWHYWDLGKWQPEGAGFSSRHCQEIKELENEPSH